MPVNDFKWVEIESRFNEAFIKGFNEDSNEGHFLKMMFNILKGYMTFSMIYLFLPDRKKFEKVEKLLSNLNNKKEYVIHIKNLKQALNH